MAWVKWKNRHGVKLMGKNKYNPPQPWGPWTKIMGVVARCEGNHDTVISYDGTGVTWGFMQWTFTSGRLQKLLSYLHSVEYYDFCEVPQDPYQEPINLFEKYFTTGGVEVFSDFGFILVDGRFYDLDRARFLDPRKKSEKKRIDDICMGRVKHHGKIKDQKKHATDLAQIFSNIGKEPKIAFAQIEFAKGEFKRSLQYTRKPLGKYKTLANLLEGTWDTYVPAVFFNLWQNSPAAAYKLTIKAKDASKSPEDMEEIVWNKLKRSKFANWSYAKPGNKSPRIRRIARAVKEFYGIKLPVK